MFHSKKLYVFFVLIFGFIFTIFRYQSSNVSNHERLVVGLQSGYPPFEFLNPEGKIVGFDIDLAIQIAEKLGKVLIIKDMEFEGEILSLKQGKIDLIISGMNITPSRLKEILMIPYHGEDAHSLSLIFWEEIPENVSSLKDIAKLSNSTISVESGSIPEMYLNKYQEIQVRSFQGALGSLMDVKYGKSIANLVETDVAEYLKQQHKEIKILTVPLEKDELISGFGIGIKKENEEFYKHVVEIIQELKNSGELKKLENKWFKGGSDV